MPIRPSLTPTLLYNVPVTLAFFTSASTMFLFQSFFSPLPFPETFFSHILLGLYSSERTSLVILLKITTSPHSYTQLPTNHLAYFMFSHKMYFFLKFYYIMCVFNSSLYLFFLRMKLHDMRVGTLSISQYPQIKPKTVPGMCSLNEMNLLIIRSTIQVCNCLPSPLIQWKIAPSS